MDNRFSIFWDAFCTASLFGIWPRFIEPYLLKVSRLRLPLLTRGTLKIVQISDLHINPSIRVNFFNKILQKVRQENPDLIAITGDFICHGILHDPKPLGQFLKGLQAPLGVFAVLGNHDYNAALSLNAEGDYDVLKKIPEPAVSGLKRLFTSHKITGTVTEEAKKVYPHPALLEVLQDASIQVLDNKTVQVGGKINITGLGELMAAQARPEVAYEKFDSSLPGITLVHNPDFSVKLNPFPGDLILSGHTHGGQVNLPWIWRRFTTMENKNFKSGLYQVGNKRLYISKGVGGASPFRFNAIPEISSILLESVS